MLTLEQARQFAQEWAQEWNSHDLEKIMSHYADEVVLTSPTAARLLKDPAGKVVGKQALRNYFSVGLQAYPNLMFRVLDVACGIPAIVIYYENQNGVRVFEQIEFGPDQKVVRVNAHYSA